MGSPTKPDTLDFLDHPLEQATGIDTSFLDKPITDDLETRHKKERQAFLDRQLNAENAPGAFKAPPIMGISGYASMQRGTIGRSVMDMGYHAYQDLRDMTMDDAKNGFLKAGKNFLESAQSLSPFNPGDLVRGQNPFHPIESAKNWAGLAKGVLYDGLIKPAIVNPAVVALNPNMNPDEKEKLIGESALLYGSFGLGALVSKGIGAFGVSALNELRAAKTLPEQISLLEKMSPETLLKTAAIAGDAPSVLSDITKHAIGITTGAIPYGFISGNTPEERVSNAFQFGLMGGLLGTMTGVGKKVIGVKSTPVDAVISENATNVFKSKQIPFVMERLAKDPLTMMDHAVAAFNSGDVNKIIADNVKPGESVLLRGIPKVDDLKSNADIVYHTRADKEVIGIATHPDSPLSDKQRSQFAQYGFHEDQVVHYGGNRYIISTTKPFEGVKNPTVKIANINDGTPKKTRIEISKIDYSPNYETIKRDVAGEVIGNTTKASVPKQFMDLGIGADEAVKFTDHINAGEKVREAQVNDVVSRASSLGLYIREDGAGKISVIEHSTGKPLSEITTLVQLDKAIEGFGGVAGKELFHLAGSLPGDVVDMGNLPKSGGPRGFTRGQSALAKFEMGRPLAGVVPSLYGKAVEGLFPQIKAWTQGFLPLEIAFRKVQQHSQPYRESLKTIDRLMIGMDKNRTETLFGYLETASPEQRMGSDPSTRANRSRNMTADEIEFGKRGSEIEGGHDGLIKTLSSWLESKKLYDDEGGKRQIRDIMDEVSVKNNLTQNQVEYLDALQGIQDKGLDVNEFSLGHSIDLSKSILLKELSKKDYSVTNNMTPKELETAKKIQDWTDKTAPYLGVGERQMLNHYMPRILDGNKLVTASPVVKALGLGQFEIDPTFKHSLIRMGIGSDYLRDPIQALDTYFHEGVKRNYLSTPINDFNKFASKSAEELEKIAPGASDMYLRTMRLRLSEMQHIPTEADKSARAVAVATGEKLGNVPRTDAERLANRFLGTATFTTMGYSPIQGARDATTWMMAYSMFLDHKALGKAIKLGLQSDAFIEGKLQKNGLLPPQLQRILISDDATREMGSTPGWQPTLKKHYAELKEKIGEQAFAFTMQRQVNEFIHRAAVLERVSTVADAFKDFQRTKNRTRFENDINLDAYSPADINKFNSLIDNGRIADAAEYLGVVTGHHINGVYGLANHPLGWGSNLGRLFGQYGQWPTWMLHTLSHQLLGPNKIKVAAKLAANTAALGAIGVATGANLASWSMLPQNLIFNGSPAAQMVSTSIGAVTGNPDDRRRFANYLPWNSPKQVYIPVPFAVWNLIDAAGVFEGTPLQDGSDAHAKFIADNPVNGIMKAFGISQAPWTMFGVPINEQAKGKGFGPLKDLGQ